MKSCDLFPTYTKFLHRSGFLRWFNSQFFWRLTSSGNAQQISFQLGRSPFLFFYGFSAIVIGIFGFYVAFGIQPMFLSALQQDFASRTYDGLLRTSVINNLLFLLPCFILVLGIWLIGFKGTLIVDPENQSISKRYNCFNLSFWSRTWSIKPLKELSCGSYGNGFVSSKIFQLRLVWDHQPSKSILTCGGAFREPLYSMAERIAAELNVPLTSHLALHPNFRTI